VTRGVSSTDRIVTSAPATSRMPPPQHNPPRSSVREKSRSHAGVDFIESATAERSTIMNGQEFIVESQDLAIMQPFSGPERLTPNKTVWSPAGESLMGSMFGVCRSRPKHVAPSDSAVLATAHHECSPRTTALDYLSILAMALPAVACRSNKKSPCAGLF
jgi:hypothetical protein